MVPPGLSVFWRNEILPAFDPKDDLDVNLYAGAGPFPMMPLLTELGN
jgi:hypothetical protein